MAFLIGFLIGVIFGALAGILTCIFAVLVMNRTNIVERMTQAVAPDKVDAEIVELVEMERLEKVEKGVSLDDVFHENNLT